MSRWSPPMAPDDIAVDAIAAAVDEPVDRVRKWLQLGLLVTDPIDTSSAIERARLVAFAVRRGLTAEAIAETCAEHDLIGRFAEMIVGTDPRRTHSVGEVADASG